MYDDSLPNSSLNPAESILEMKEFCFHFETGAESIRPVSLRYILPTQTASITLKQSMKDLLILPSINVLNFRGSALALRSNQHVSGTDLTGSILMLDQDINNLYTH